MSRPWTYEHVRDAYAQRIHRCAVAWIRRADTNALVWFTSDEHRVAAKRETVKMYMRHR